MTHQITINYDLEYRGQFKIEMREFDCMLAGEIEAHAEELIQEHVRANVSAHAKNMPALVAEIVEGLKALEAERAEEEV